MIHTIVHFGIGIEPIIEEQRLGLYILTVLEVVGMLDINFYFLIVTIINVYNFI